MSVKITTKIPRKEKLNIWLEKRREESLSYSFPEITRYENTFPGYNHDKNQYYLGQGEETYKKACEALLAWKMFPSPWTKVHAPFKGFPVGKQVIVLFKMFGVWWHNSCRILYQIEEENRFGFAYGTLQSHVEKGEEVFYIERNEKGQVFYKIEAFSRPNKWFTKIGYPIARAWQKKFVRDGFMSMKKAILDIEIV